MFSVEGVQSAKTQKWDNKAILSIQGSERSSGGRERDGQGPKTPTRIAPLQVTGEDPRRSAISVLLAAVPWAHTILH